MFGRKKQQQPAAILEKISSGFFSSRHHVGIPAVDMAIAIESAIDKSIQIKPGDMVIAGNSNGSNPGHQSMAMDEAYPNLQLVKMQNSLGGGVPGSQLVWYAEQGFIGYQTCAILMQNWFISKACALPARDAVRNGYEITSNDGSDFDPEILTYIRKRDKAFAVKNNCQEFIRFGRGFGIRIAKFEVDSPDPLYYEKPFNIDGVRPFSYKGISQIDPYWIYPELDQQAAANPASKHFYEPTYWTVNGKRIHRSHLIIMKEGGDVADILKPTYYYGGISIAQKIAERVFSAERTANEAPMLAMTKRLIVLKTDISQVTANLEGFSQKMSFWSGLMNNFGVKIIGEGEEVEQHDTSLADLSETINGQFQLACAVAGIPEAKMMEVSPKGGLGSEGGFEIQSYHESLESYQEHDLSPLVDRHHLLLMKSEIQPKFGIFVETEIVWNDTDVPTKKEQAEINKIKAETGNQLVQSGAIDGTDERERIIADKDSGYNGMPDIVPGGPGDREAQQEAEKALEQPVSAKAKSGEGEK